MYVWTSVFLVSLALLGCQKVSKVESAATPKVSVGGLRLTAKTIPRAEPQSYYVELTWETSEEIPSGTLWSIRRADKEQIETRAREKMTFADTDVKAGQVYHYQVELAGAAMDGMIAKQEIRIPQDFVVGVNNKEVKDGREVTNAIARIKGYGRLFIGYVQGGDTISVLNRDLAIEVDEIVSQNGVIQAFERGKTSPDGVPGRNGGKISVKARKLSGSKLNIFGNGEDGANERNGFSAQRGGNSPSVYVNIAEGDGQRPELELKVGGGLGGLHFPDRPGEPGVLLDYCVIYGSRVYEGSNCHLF